MKLSSMATITGTISAAILASSCCVGPLILAGLGIGSIGAFSSLEKYRPLFVIITFAFIMTSFYFIYRTKKNDECCDINNVKIDRIKKVTLWAITIVAVGLLLFPYIYGYFGNATSIVQMNDDLQKVVIRVEGMTCKACVKDLSKNKIPNYRDCREEKFYNSIPHET